jgi:hypothetical protein
VTEYDVKSIPNSERLRPLHHHEAHDMYLDMLLEPRGVTATREMTSANVCYECVRDLKKSTHYPPRYSLANNLWIGHVPWELSRLTVPEQMLIALLYPRVFVYKLYNKTWNHQDTTTLQRGMRGTVCTYELNMDEISTMVRGQLMPRPLEVLSSIIVVTFIGQSLVRSYTSSHVISRSSTGDPRRVVVVETQQHQILR